MHIHRLFAYYEYVHARCGSVPSIELANTDRTASKMYPTPSGPPYVAVGDTGGTTAGAPITAFVRVVGVLPIDCFSLRVSDSYFVRFAWAIPDERALRIVEHFGPVVEVSGCALHTARRLKPYHSPNLSKRKARRGTFYHGQQYIQRNLLLALRSKFGVPET